VPLPVRSGRAPGATVDRAARRCGAAGRGGVGAGVGLGGGAHRTLPYRRPRNPSNPYRTPYRTPCGVRLRLLLLGSHLGLRAPLLDQRGRDAAAGHPAAAAHPPQQWRTRAVHAAAGMRAPQQHAPQQHGTASRRPPPRQTPRWLPPPPMSCRRSVPRHGSSPREPAPPRRLPTVPPLATLRSGRCTLR